MTDVQTQAGRNDYGFARTSCACRRCAISCEHVPGALSPDDLPRMAAALGYGDNVLAFARDNLLASEGVQVRTDRGASVRLPTLVPATRPAGHCKFLDGGKCTIHAVSPYGCAFIDAHQGDAEYAVRADALYRALHDDQKANGTYGRVWTELSNAGSVAPPLAQRNWRLHKAMKREKLL